MKEPQNVSIVLKLQVISSIDLTRKISNCPEKGDEKGDKDHTEVVTRTAEHQANLVRNILLSSIGT